MDVLGSLNADGTVPADVAAKAFSVVFGPLPGVVTPDGVDPSLLPADAVLRWIDASRDELTEEQRLAVDAALSDLEDPYVAAENAFVGAALAKPRTATSHQVCGTFLGDGEPPLGVPEAVRPFAETVSALVGDYNRKLGRAGLLKMAVCVESVGDSLHPVLGRVKDSDGRRIGPPDHCVVYIRRPNYWAEHHFNMHLAYSTFTCFRDTAQPGETLADRDAANRPAWYVEGVSTWAAGMAAVQHFGGAVQTLGRYWLQYLEQHPKLSLIARTFDAMGFFAQVEQAGQGMWSNVDSVLRATDSRLAWDAALTGVESNEDFFPAGFFREPFRGADWDITGPGIESFLAPIDELDLEAGSILSVASDAFGVGFAKVTSDTDVVTVKGNLWTRISDGGVDYRGINESSYCTAEGGDCTCPEGFTPLIEGLQPLGPEFAVAMTGTVEPAQIFLIGLALEQFCEPNASDPPGSPTSDDRDCDQIITEGELEAAIGVPLALIEKSGTPPAEIPDAEGLHWTSCTYELPNGHRVALEFGYFPNPAVVRSEYDAMRARAEFDPVEVVGIGDAAFEAPPAPIVFLVAIRDTWFFLMSGLTADVGGSHAVFEDMARRAFSRVP